MSLKLTGSLESFGVTDRCQLSGGGGGVHYRVPRVRGAKLRVQEARFGGYDRGGPFLAEGF